MIGDSRLLWICNH